jgi:hypothetical protein
MGKQASAVTTAQRESTWRDRFARHAASGQSVEAFCRSEAVSVATFYHWRTRLRSRNSEPAMTRQPVSAPSPFIDLGSVKRPIACAAVPGNEDTSHHTPARLEVRIDLGAGVVLTIARH